jgi:alpha-D-xyloside xylohydrolase
MMDKPVPWSDFAASLDYTKYYSGQPVLGRWLDYQATSSGLQFNCQIDHWIGKDGKAGPRIVPVRLDVITGSIIRFRMGLASFRDRPSDMLVRQEWPSVPFQTREENGVVILSTNRIRVEIQQFPWRMQMFACTASDVEPVFSQQVCDFAYGPAYEVAPVGFQAEPGGCVSVHESVAVTPGEAFYGFGEKFSSLNKWNQEITSWSVDSGNVSSPRSYKNIPFFMSTAGYGIFVHSSYPIVYRMGSQSAISYSFHVMDQELDYFLIYGPSFKDILKGYCGLTGFAPVPPKWSFGFWLSRAGYKNREEVESVVFQSRSQGFPIDVISIDPWWMGNGPWTTLEWDQEAFPKPEEMIAGLRRQNVKTCLWITPYLPAGSRIHREAVEQKYILAKPDGSPSPVVEMFTGSALAAVDFTNPHAVTWYQSWLEKLLAMGVAVFKTDFGEQAPVDAIYQDGRTGLEMHNLYPLLYNRTVYELTRRFFGRGLVWGRSAYAGSQRYPVQWGGDSYASLAQLRTQLEGLLSYGMSGVPFCSHDIGGFDYSPASFYYSDQQASEKDPELYIRWLQFGTFSSHMRAHGKQPREPWAYGEEAAAIAKKFLNLRYRLLPYIYSEAVRSSQTGLPMVRPLVLDYQSDPNTHSLDCQYLFGESLLVAPVLSRSRRQKVYLPAGDWFDFWTKERTPGGRWVETESPLDRLPVWVKGGSILPLGPAMQFVGAGPLDPLTLEIYGSSENQSAEIFDEDKPPVQAACRWQNGRIQVEVAPTPGLLELNLFGIRAVSARSNNQLLPLEDIRNGQVLHLDGRRGTDLVLDVLKDFSFE